MEIGRTLPSVEGTNGWGCWHERCRLLYLTAIDRPCKATLHIAPLQDVKDRTLGFSKGGLKGRGGGGCFFAQGVRGSSILTVWHNSVSHTPHDPFKDGAFLLNSLLGVFPYAPKPQDHVHRLD